MASCTTKVKLWGRYKLNSRAHPDSNESFPQDVLREYLEASRKATVKEKVHFILNRSGLQIGEKGFVNSVSRSSDPITNIVKAVSFEDENKILLLGVVHPGLDEERHLIIVEFKNKDELSKAVNVLHSLKTGQAAAAQVPGPPPGDDSHRDLVQQQWREQMGHHDDEVDLHDHYDIPENHQTAVVQVNHQISEEMISPYATTVQHSAPPQREVHEEEVQEIFNNFNFTENSMYQNEGPSRSYDVHQMSSDEMTRQRSKEYTMSDELVYDEESSDLQTMPRYTRFDSTDIEIIEVVDPYDHHRHHHHDHEHHDYHSHAHHHY